MYPCTRFKMDRAILFLQEDIDSTKRLKACIVFLLCFFYHFIHNHISKMLLLACIFKEDWYFLCVLLQVIIIVFAIYFVARCVGRG